MMRLFLSTALVALSLSLPVSAQEIGLNGFSDEEKELHKFSDEAARCIAGSGFALESVRAEKKDDHWVEVTGWLGDVFFYAGNVKCASGKMFLKEVMVIRGKSSVTETRPARALKADSITLSGKVKPECGPLSGIGIDSENVRWFSWDGEGNSTDRYYEIVKNAENSKEQRIRTSAHFKASEILWSPTVTTPCAVSGKFAASNAEVRWRGIDRSRIGVNSILGEVTLHHPKVSLNVDGVRDSEAIVEFVGVNLFNVADKNVATSDRISFSASASAPGSAPIRLMMGKYFRPYVIGTAEGMASLLDIFPLDLSNALGLTDMTVRLSSEGFMAEPSIAIPASLGINLGTARLAGSGAVGASFSGDGDATFTLNANIPQMLSFDLSMDADLKRFDKMLLESVAGGRTAPDAAPFLDSFTVTAKDDGIDSVIYSGTGRTLRDMLGINGAQGFSGAAYEWMRGFRAGEEAMLTAILTAPLRMGQGMWNGLYASQGTFNASSSPRG